MAGLGLPGVSFGGVSRASEGASARSSYQMGNDVRDGVLRAKRRDGRPVTHVAQWILLPTGVDEVGWTREALWTAADVAERRRDARAARFFDVNWPRELPTNRIEAFVHALFGDFVTMGLPVQVDWESCIAADGIVSDHLHGMMATRRLTTEGFEKTKYRDLDKWFLSGVRSRVADLLNDIARDLGLDLDFDPRPNAERDHELPPEAPIPRALLRNPTSARARALLEQRDDQRQRRRTHRAMIADLEALEARAAELLGQLRRELDYMTVLTAAPNEDTSPLPLKVALSALWAQEIPVRKRTFLPEVGLVLLVEETLFVDTGDRIHISGAIEGRALGAMHTLARTKGWPRGLSMLASTGGLPRPVPPAPEPRPARVPVKKDRLALLGKGTVTAVVVKLLAQLTSQEDRIELVDRIMRRDDAALEAVAMRLVALAEHRHTAEIGTAEVQDLIEDAMGDNSGLWLRHRLELDLFGMTMPGRLSRPFTPPPGFHETYGISV